MKLKVQVISIVCAAVFTTMGIYFINDAHSESCHLAAMEEQARANTPPPPPNHLGFTTMEEFNRTYPVHTCQTVNSADIFNILVGGIIAYLVAAVMFSFFFKITD